MKNTRDIRYAGQPLAKGDKSTEGSFIRVPKKQEGDCCKGDLISACQDTIVVPLSTGTKKITKATFDGKEYTHAAGFTRLQTKELYTWLASIIIEKEIDARLWVELNAAGDQVTITHTGVLSFDSVQQGANNLAATRKCVAKSKCDYVFSMIGDVDNGNKITVYHNNKATELAGTFTYNAAGNAAAQTANNNTANDLKTKLNALWGAGSVSAVTPNVDCHCYKVMANVYADAGDYSENGELKDCDTVFE